MLVISGKPRRQTTAYGFFLKACRDEEKSLKKNVSINFIKFSISCAEKWRNMNQSKKKAYYDLAEKDKQRYLSQMKQYAALVQSEYHIKGKNKGNFPKRPLSSFFLFCREERSKVKISLSSSSSVQIAKELGRRWRAMSAADKEKYERLARNDRERYKKEMSEFYSKPNGDNL